MGWPKKVPILSASEIFQGGIVGDNNDRCLIGWCVHVFPDAEIRYGVVDLIHKETGSRMAIGRWNDSHTKRQCAAVWNRAMKRLGFTEPCER